ncbi:PIN domain-containing protein [Planktothrix agardhii]|uniref:PIN domain-containing protein n=1 Tax=Planktothrix agardhii TaxID=1160 RepID=UPI003C6E62A4
MLHSCVLLKFLLIIAIDTNIIVRFITRDDELQYQQSLELFKNKNIFIPDTVILETEWVLRFAYNPHSADRGQIFH